MILDSDELSEDDSLDPEFILPDVTPFRRTHDDEAGSSSVAAAAPPASQAQPDTPDIATQIAALTSSVRVMADTFVQMQQAQFIKEQTEERF
jgi:hypothetical protein